MSYNEEQTRAYNSMLYACEQFDIMKKTLSNAKCQTHNKKLKMSVNWERDYDTDVIIYNYCCANFAEQIAKKLIDAAIFTSVTIEE